MTPDSARRWLILASLGITGVQAVFLVLAPAIGVPFDTGQNISLLQIITPIFVGYLGSATHFIFMVPPPSVEVNIRFLGLLVRGPILVYAAIVVAAFAAFMYTNRIGAPIGGNVTFDALSNALTIALSVLAATTGVIISYLFAVERREAATQNQQQQPPSSA